MPLKCSFLLCEVADHARAVLVGRYLQSVIREVVAVHIYKLSVGVCAVLICCAKNLIGTLVHLLIISAYKIGLSHPIFLTARAEL